jgi:hypothetical protein
MIFKKGIEKQIFSLLLISLSGGIFHLNRHPISENPSNFVPFIFGILTIFFVPILLNFKQTYFIAYLINGFSVIIGAVLMATLSISRLTFPISFSDIFFRTLLGDIFILTSKLFIGQMILYHYHPNGLGRLFTAWWWTRHFVYFTTVFSIGHWLWR